MVRIVRSSTRAFALLGTVLAGCGQARFEAAGDAQASGGTGGSVPDGSGGSDVHADASEVVSTTLRIENDGDDGVWLNGTDEGTHHGLDMLTLEVGADAEAARTGLIFHLPVPPGSVINSARIDLHRIDGNAAATETMQVQVWDSCQVPPFDDTHVHAPAEHVAEGLWPTAVTGFAVGTDNTDILSPELAPLTQHVVDKPEWATGATVGYFLSPAAMVSWVMFDDSSAGTGAATLKLSYTPP